MKGPELAEIFCLQTLKNSHPRLRSELAPDLGDAIRILKMLCGDTGYTLI